MDMEAMREALWEAQMSIAEVSAVIKKMCIWGDIAYNQTDTEKRKKALIQVGGLGEEAQDMCESLRDMLYGAVAALGEEVAS